MGDTPPPTEHVLRPHHVGLLTLFMLTFKEFESRTLPPPFLLHVYRVLLNEVSEVSQPKTSQELITALIVGPKSDAEEPMSLINALKGAPSNLITAEQMTDFFGSVKSLFVEKPDDDVPILMRRSIFGYFCRRCFVSFLKLSFSGVVKLQKDYQSWCAGDLQAGYEPVVKDELNNANLLIFKTHADKKSWAQPHAYGVWEKGQATGDENIATENLRRFFEQHFHESNDSGVRQHALLNLVRMHYVRGEHVAAQKLLSEAIAVARTSGDKLTLQHCISMQHRLPPAEMGRKAALNEIQPDLNPLEVLFDVRKLIHVKYEQPISASFTRIFQAVGLYDNWIDVQLAGSTEKEQWAQHAVQSILWTIAGCDQLAAIEEKIVIAFTEVGGDDNSRITMILNKAYKLARQGQYENGLKMLLEPCVWCGLTLDDYVSWARQIWHIVVLRSIRRGQDRLYREFLISRRPPGEFNPRDYLFHVTSLTDPKIRDPLYEVIQMRQFNQAASAIEHLLTALWHSEFLCHFTLYRTGIILLADVGLEFGMSKRCRRILDEIMPQVINGNELEQRALACFTLARCIIAAEDASANGLHQVIPYLLMAESDFRTLEMLGPLMDVQYLLSVVYHNLGLEKERDEAAKRRSATEEQRNRLEAIVVDNEIEGIFEVVSLVGAALSRR